MPEGGRAPCNMAIAQGQQGRLCFAFLFEEDEEKAQEGRSSQVNTLPKAKSETRSKQNKDMHKCRSVYSERGVPLPVLASGVEWVGVRA